ncbi:tail fiber domain-containing protein [Gammaproteobacteria bacterium]|nr:tail fiber domain-containing protein [Gammaproteobacteria bacterium]
MAILQATSFSGSVDIDTLRLDGESLTKADIQGFKEVDTRITESAGNQIIGTDSDISTSGATIVGNLYMTDGVITSHGTRVLTLANLGYTGATNANYITNNNQLTNGSGYQTSTQVNNAIQGVVDAAPAALDTLNELAASLNDDSDFAGTMTTALAGKQATLTAGSNITITDGTISSTDTNTNTQLSDAQVRSKFSAGTNVAISSGGVISSTDTNTNTQLSTAQVRGKFSGTGINTSTGVITNTNTQLSDAQVRSKFSAGTNVAISNTGVISSTDTNTVYTHPTFNGDDFSVDTGALTGATVVSDIDINVTTDGNGHVTDANGSVATRTLTLANLGYTGATNANYITNNNQLTNGASYLTTSGKAADSEKVDGINGASLLRSDADDSFSGGLVSTARDEGIFGTYDPAKTDHIWSMGTAYKNHASGTNFGNLYGLAYKHTNNTTGGTMAGGHQMVWASNGTPKSAMGDNIWTSGTVTATGGNSTQWNTAYDWGNHASAGYLTSYTDTNTQLSTAQVRAKFTAGTNVAISSGGVISSTDTNTNTTYSAGRGLDISGTTFNLETDLRDSISYIGYDSNDYIQWSNNGWTRTVVNGTERLRVDTAGIDVSGRAKIDTTLTVGSNHINGGNYSTIAGGTLNLNCQYYGTIAGGYSNGLCTYYSGNGYSFIGAGACNLIKSGLWSAIVSGCNNKILTQGSIDGCQGNFIGGGNNNYIMANNRSSIVGGCQNNIYDQSDCSIIGGGHVNAINHSEKSIIGGGLGNYISNGCHQTISGGAYNLISSACETTGDTISGGEYNKICNNSNSSQNTIAGGCNNQICTYYHGNNFIGGGKSNIIQSSYGAGNSIIGGYNNRVYGGANITIIGGSSISASSTNYVYVSNLCNVGGGTSDCRLKESICNIPYGLSHVSQLEPVSYKFTSDESKATKYGFLAQCVQEIMPDLITNHPTALVDGTPVLQFDKDAIWSSMVNAIKDLKNEVDALKARIDILEA